MDNEVTRLLEGAAARVTGVREISAASEEGNARARIYFSPEIDINNAANDVREAISEIRGQLPDGVDNVFVIKANDESDPIMRVSVASPALSDEDLTKLVEDQVIPELLGVPGVADVQPNGDRQRTLRVVVDPMRLATYRLSIDRVARAIENAGLDVPAGSFSSRDQDLIVRADAALIEARRIAAIRLNRTTRLSDVASVYYAPEEPESYVRLDGRPVISLGVIRQAQSNTIEISEGVHKAVDRLNRRFADAEVSVISDDAVFIRGATREVLFTLAIGIGIVILVTMIFLGSPKFTLIPAVTIPVALMGTIAGIWLLDFSVNMLTLLALVLATGLVVDDAIVVLENIERTRRSGHAPRPAAVLGTRQVFFAVIATTVTLASVFIPIAFLPGRAGQLFTEFGFVLALAVGISSFVALSLCPMMASRLRHRDGPAGLLRRPLAAAGSAFARLYDRSLGAAMRAPVLVCGAALGLAALVGTLFLDLEHELVPKEDRGLITVSMRGPEGANQDYMDRQVRKVEDMVRPLVRSREVTGILSLVGRYDPNRGFVILPLAPWGERRSQAEIMAALEPKLKQIPGARTWFWQRNSLGIRTSGSELEFALTGPNYEDIAKAGDRVLAAIKEQIPGLDRARMDYSTTQPQLEIEIDRERAADLGIDLAAVARTLEAMVQGSEVIELNVRDETVPVIIESALGAVNDTDDLANLHVMTDRGRAVPLSSLIRIRESAAAMELDREAQRRAIEIEGELTGGLTLDAAVAGLERIAREVLPTGIDLVLLGEAEALEEAARDMA
ncbi:MAG TPA: efflux RND transporter permease subunit, partial [Alphaproteobacteria bacterium]|nr:efflux RND transporter permease subunit [Alphaproteobacteria bacterium]